jgi:hypothetical protein
MSRLSPLARSGHCHYGYEDSIKPSVALILRQQWANHSDRAIMEEEDFFHDRGLSYVCSHCLLMLRSFSLLSISSSHQLLQLTNSTAWDHQHASLAAFE